MNFFPTILIRIYPLFSPAQKNSVHGRTMMCPHPRVISNLVSVCLATIFSLFEYRQLDSIHHGHQSIKNVADTDLDQIDDEEWQIHVNCFIDMFRFM